MSKVKTSEEIAEMKKTIAQAEAAPPQQLNIQDLDDDAREALIATLLADKHKADIAASAGLLEQYLPRLVGIVKDGGKIKAAHPKWNLPFTMRADNILSNAVLARGKASAQNIMDDIGEYLPYLLGKDIDTGVVPEPLTWIITNLAEKSKKVETGKNKAGNPTYSRSIFKDNGDGTYSLAE